MSEKQNQEGVGVQREEEGAQDRTMKDAIVSGGLWYRFSQSYPVGAVFKVRFEQSVPKLRHRS